MRIAKKGKEKDYCVRNSNAYKNLLALENRKKENKGFSVEEKEN